MKLNFGCGSKPLEGWVNFDLHPTAGDIPVYYLDLNEHLQGQLSDAFVPADEVLLSHVLEHIVAHRSVKVLRNIRNILVPGGILTVEVPNMAEVFEAWPTASYEERWEAIEQGGNRYPALRHYIWGQGQVPEGQLHFTGFDEEHLRHCLEEAKFTSIMKCEPRLGYSIRLKAQA